MKRVMFAPYNFRSEGCRNLAKGIGAVCTRATKRFKRDVTIINWGRSNLYPRGYPKVLNDSTKVVQATNKLSCLNILSRKNVPCVEHTISMHVVSEWLSQPDTIVYGRRLLNASQGKGIIIVKDFMDIPYCPLYTKGILNAHEYRVHIFKDKVIDVTKKRRRNGIDRNDYIKNVSNGWVYCREGIVIPDVIMLVSKNAVAALGLDFGAVDVLVRKGVAYVLEVNTAPGLSGTTLNRYIYHFNNLKYEGNVL